MRHFLKFIPIFLVAAALNASSVTVGSNDGGNCYPFSCGPSDNITRYQQVYTAAAFGTAPLLINSITVFLSQGGDMDGGDYALSFSTTSATVATLSSNLSSNVGLDSSAFGNVSIAAGPMPSSLTIAGTQFLYDPALGNLLLDVAVTNGVGFGAYQSFFQADYTQVDTARAWSSSSNGDFGASAGALVTQFDTSNVPEPGTYGMLAMGVGALWTARRRLS